MSRDPAAVGLGFALAADDQRDREDSQRANLQAELVAALEATLKHSTYVPTRIAEQARAIIAKAKAAP